MQGQSQIAVEALDIIGELYAIEREAAQPNALDRQRLRQEQARPILERLHDWLLQRREQVPNSSAIARADRLQPRGGQCAGRGVLVALLAPLAVQGDGGARQALGTTAAVMLVLKKPLPAIAAGIVAAALFRQI